MARYVSFDSFLFYILRSIYDSSINKKKITTWDVAEKYNWGNSKKFESQKHYNRYYTNKTNLVRQRLKKMTKYGIAKIDNKNGNKTTYILDGSKIKFKKHKFENGIKDSLHLKIDGKWIVFEL